MKISNYLIGANALYSDDSESSVPPRNRKSIGNEQSLVRRDGNNPNSGTVALRGGSDGTHRSTNGYGSGSDSDSASSSDVSISSGEDERRARNLKYQIPLTAGLAAVASIHAVNGIRKNVKKRDKRIEMKVKGEITEEESKKLENRGLWQDAAAVALAGLAIKGIHAKWTGVSEQAKEYQEQKRVKRERHEKREGKREKRSSRGYGGSGGGGYEQSGGRYANSEQDLGRSRRPRDRDSDRY